MRGPTRTRFEDLEPGTATKAAIPFTNPFEWGDASCEPDDKPPMGFEPTTSPLPRERSTTELRRRCWTNGPSVTTAPTEVRAKSHCTKSGDVGNILKKSIPLNQAAYPEPPPKIPCRRVGGRVGLATNPLQLLNIVKRSDGFSMTVQEKHQACGVIPKIDLSSPNGIGKHIEGN